MEEVPEKVKYPDLYREIRNRIRREDPQTSAYRSLRIIREYKQASNEKYGDDGMRGESESRLKRWLAEKWIQVPAFIDGEEVECGSGRTQSVQLRNKVALEMGKACRPSVRVDRKTPITVQELLKRFDKEDVARFARRKAMAEERGEKIRADWENLKFKGFEEQTKLKLIKKVNGNKKYEAVFDTPMGEVKTQFGASGYRDFTLINDKRNKFYLPDEKDRNEIKNMYIKRHKNEENLWRNEPTSAAALSRWILWNKPTIQDSIDDFRRRLGV